MKIVTRRQLNRWSSGQPITAERLNEPIDTLRELLGVLPARLLEEGRDDAEVTEEEQVSSDERWAFESKTELTNRLFDSTDPEVFVDVTRATSVSVRLPDGRKVTIELE